MTDLDREVYDAIYPQLPLRVRMMGPKHIRKLVTITLQELPSREVYGASDSAHQARMREALAEQVKSTYLFTAKDERCGFAIMTLILTAAISALVNQIIQWWWNHPRRMEAVEQWQSKQ